MTSVSAQQNVSPTPLVLEGESHDKSRGSPLASPQTTLVAPQTPLAGPQTPLASTQTLLAGPQTPLASLQTLLAGS